MVSGVGFGPKPTSVPNFIEIGVGDRNLVLTSLIFGLLRLIQNIEKIGCSSKNNGVWGGNLCQRFCKMFFEIKQKRFYNNCRLVNLVIWSYDPSLLLHLAQSRIPLTIIIYHTCWCSVDIISWTWIEIRFGFTKKPSVHHLTGVYFERWNDDLRTA